MAAKDKKKKRARTPRPSEVRSSWNSERVLPAEVVQLGVPFQVEYDTRVNRFGENPDDVIASQNINAPKVSLQKPKNSSYKGKYGPIPKSVAQAGEEVAAVYDLAVNRDKKYGPDSDSEWHNSMYAQYEAGYGNNYLEYVRRHSAVLPQGRSFRVTNAPSTVQKMEANKKEYDTYAPLNDNQTTNMLHVLYPELINPTLAWAKEQAAKRGMPQAVIDAHNKVAFFVNVDSFNASNLKKGSVKEQRQNAMVQFRQDTELKWKDNQPTDAAYLGSYEDNWGNLDIRRQLAFWENQIGSARTDTLSAATRGPAFANDPLTPNSGFQTDAQYVSASGYTFTTIAQARLLKDTTRFEKAQALTFKEADAIEMLKIQQQFPGLSPRIISLAVSEGKTIKTDSEFLNTLSAAGGYSTNGEYSLLTGEKLTPFQLRRLTATQEYVSDTYITEGDYKRFAKAQVTASVDEAFFTSAEIKKKEKEEDEDDDGFLGWVADNSITNVFKNVVGAGADMLNFPYQVGVNAYRFGLLAVGAVERDLSGKETWAEERKRLENNVRLASGSRRQAKAEQALAQFNATAPTVTTFEEAAGNIISGTTLWQADVEGVDTGNTNPIMGPEIGSEADQEVGRLARSYGAYADTGALWRKNTNEYTSYAYTPGRTAANLVFVPGTAEFSALSGLIDAPIAMFLDPLNKVNPIKWIKAARSIQAVDATVNAVQASTSVAKAAHAAGAANNVGGLSGWLKAKMGVATISEYLKSSKGVERVKTFANMAADQEYGKLSVAANGDADTVRLFGNAGSPEVLSGEARLETGYDSLLARESLRNLDNASRPDLPNRATFVGEAEDAATSADRAVFYDTLQMDAKKAHASENPYEQFGIPGGTSQQLTANGLISAQAAAKKSGKLSTFNRQVFDDIGQNVELTFSPEQMALINAAQDARNVIAKERHIKFISGVIEQKHLDLWAAGKFSEVPPSIAKKAYMPMRVALFAGAGAVVTPMVLSPATDQISGDDTVDGAVKSMLGYLGFAVGVGGSKQWKFAPGFDMMPQFRIATKLGDKSDAMEQMRRIYVQGKMSAADMNAMVKDFVSENFNMLKPITKAFHRVAEKTLISGKGIQALITKYNLGKDADLFGKATDPSKLGTEVYQRGALWEAAKEAGNVQDMELIASQIKASDYIMQGISKQIGDYAEISGIFHKGKYYQGSTSDTVLTMLDEIQQNGRLSNGSELTPSELPLLVSQFLSGDIPLPIDFARKLRNSTYKYGRLMQSDSDLVRAATLGGTTAALYAFLDAGGDPESFFDANSIVGTAIAGAAGGLAGKHNISLMRKLDLYNSNIFKPFALVTRLAYPVRVISEEQVRMSTAGLASMFTHPLSFFAWVMMAPNDIYLRNFSDFTRTNEKGVNQFIQASASRTGFQALNTSGAIPAARTGNKITYDLLTNASNQQVADWPTALANKLHVAYMDAMTQLMAQQIWYARSDNRVFNLQKFLEKVWEAKTPELKTWRKQIAANKESNLILSNQEVFNDYVERIYDAVVAHSESTANNTDLIEIIGFAGITRDGVRLPLWDINANGSNRLINPEVETIFRETVEKIKLENKKRGGLSPENVPDPNVVRSAPPVASSTPSNQMAFEDVELPTEDVIPTFENVAQAEDPAVKAVLSDGEDMDFSKAGLFPFYARKNTPVAKNATSPAEKIIREVMDIKRGDVGDQTGLSLTTGKKRIPGKKTRKGKQTFYPANQRSVFDANGIPNPTFVEKIDDVVLRTEQELNKANAELAKVTGDIAAYDARFAETADSTVINVDAADKILQEKLQKAKNDLAYKTLGTGASGSQEAFDEAWAVMEARMKRDHARFQAAEGTRSRNVSESVNRLNAEQVAKNNEFKQAAKRAKEKNASNLARVKYLEKDIEELKNLKIMADKVKTRKQFKVHAAGGSATILDRGAIADAFRPLYQRAIKGDEVVIVLGDADGFDAIAADLARSMGFTVEVVPLPKKRTVNISVAEDSQIPMGDAEAPMAENVASKSDVTAGDSGAVTETASQEAGLEAFKRRELIASGGETGNAPKLVFVFDNPSKRSPNTIKIQNYYETRNGVNSGRYAPGEGDSRANTRFADPNREGYDGGAPKANQIPSPDPSGRTPPQKNTNDQAAVQNEVDNFSATTQDHSFERDTREADATYRQPGEPLGPQPYMAYSRGDAPAPNPDLVVPVVTIQGKTHTAAAKTGPQRINRASVRNIPGGSLNSPGAESVSLEQMLSDGRASGFTIREDVGQTYDEGQQLVFGDSNEVFVVLSRKKVVANNDELRAAWSQIEGQSYDDLANTDASKSKILTSGAAYQYTVVKVPGELAPIPRDQYDHMQSTLNDFDGDVPFHKQQQAEWVVEEFGHIPEQADPDVPVQILYTGNGGEEVIASGYTRIVYTDNGPYLEFSSTQSRDNTALFANPETPSVTERPMTVRNAPEADSEFLTDAEMDARIAQAQRRTRHGKDEAFLEKIATRETEEQAELRRVARNWQVKGSGGKTIRYQYYDEASVIDPQPISKEAGYNPGFMGNSLDHRGSADFRAGHWYVPMEDIKIAVPERHTQGLEIGWLQREADFIPNLTIDDWYTASPGMSLRGVTPVDDLKTYDGVVVVVQGSPRYNQIHAEFKAGGLQGDFTTVANANRESSDPWIWSAQKDSSGTLQSAPKHIIVIPKGNLPSVIAYPAEAAVFGEMLQTVRKQIDDLGETNVIVSPLSDADNALYGKVEQVILKDFGQQDGMTNLTVAVERSMAREESTLSRVPDGVVERSAAYEPHLGAPSYQSNRPQFQGSPLVTEIEKSYKKILLESGMKESEVDDVINNILGYSAKHEEVLANLSPQTQNFVQALKAHFENMPQEDLLDLLANRLKDPEKVISELVEQNAAKEALTKLISDESATKTFMDESGVTVDELINYFNNPEGVTGASHAVGTDGFWPGVMSDELMGLLRSELNVNQAELIKYLNNNIDVAKVRQQYIKEAADDIGSDLLDVNNYGVHAPKNTSEAAVRFGLAENADEVVSHEDLKKAVSDIAEEELVKLDGKAYDRAKRKWDKKLETMSDNELYGFLEWRFKKTKELDIKVGTLSQQDLFNPTLWNQLKKNISLRKLLKESTLKPASPITLKNHIGTANGNSVAIPDEALDEINGLKTTYKKIADSVVPSLSHEELNKVKLKVKAKIENPVFELAASAARDSAEFQTKIQELRDRVEFILKELRIEQSGSPISREQQTWFLQEIDGIRNTLEDPTATPSQIFRAQKRLKSKTNTLLNHESLKWTNTEYVTSTLPEHVELTQKMDFPANSNEYLADFANSEMRSRATKLPQEKPAKQDQLPFTEPSEETSFPTSFMGDEFTPKTDASTYDAIKSTAFKWLAGVPTQVLSRSPVFRQLYWRQIVEEAQLMNPDDAQKLLKSAQRVFKTFDYNLTAPMKVAAFVGVGALGAELMHQTTDSDRLSLESLAAFGFAGLIPTFMGRKMNFQVKNVIDVTGEASKEAVVGGQKLSSLADEKDLIGGLYLNGERVSKKETVESLFTRLKDRTEPLNFVLVTKKGIPRDTAIGKLMQKLHLWEPHDFTKIEDAVLNGKSLTGGASVGSLTAPERKAMIDARTASGIPPRTLDEADQLAKEHALDGVLGLLYDLSNSTSIMDSLRIVLPFGEALSEMFKVWGNLTNQNPYSLRTGQKLLQGGEDIGFISTDDNGERVVNIPGSQYVTEFLTGTKFQLRLSLAGITQASSPVGFSPLAQIAYSVAADNVPSMDAMRKLVLPIGALDIGSNAFIVESLAPAWIETALMNVLVGEKDEITAKYMKVWGEVLKTTLTQEHDYDHDILSPNGKYTDLAKMSLEDKNRIIAEVDKATQSAFFLIAGVKAISPSQTNFEVPVTSWKGVEIPLAHLVSIMAEQIQNNPNFQIPEKLYAKFGPQINAVVGMSIMPDRAQQPLLTKKGSVWQRTRGGLRSKTEALAPDAYGFFFPATEIKGEVDMEAFKLAKDKGVIKLSNKNEMFARVSRKWGEGIYDEAERDIIYALEVLEGLVPEKNWRQRYGSLHQYLSQRQSEDLWDKPLKGGLSLWGRRTAPTVKIFLQELDRDLKKDFYGYGNKIGEMTGQDIGIQREQILKVATKLGPKRATTIDKFIKKGPASGQTQAEFNDSLLFLIITKYEKKALELESAWSTDRARSQKGWQTSTSTEASNNRAILLDFLSRNRKKYTDATDGDIRLDNLAHYVYYEDTALSERYRSQ